MNPNSRRNFTPAARAAAIEARREKALHPVDASIPKVFAVRLPAPKIGFGWEIRRYGAIVLSRSTREFGTVSEAYAAGKAALLEEVH